MNMTLSEAARAAVANDLSSDQVVRIAFAGGCGALGFRLSTPRRGNEGDLEVKLAEVTLYFDRQAANELDGATLDYDEESGFFLDHPNWGVSC